MRSLVPLDLGQLTPLPSEAPAAPGDLSAESVAVWESVWSAYPEGVLSPELDAETVARFCRLLDQRAQLVAAVDADGVTLRKAQQSARGDVVGQEIYVHPAVALILKVDR